MTTEDISEAPDVTTKLRRDVFVELCEERNLATNAAIAKHIGVSDKTVRRIVKENDDPSGEFIAKTLVRWPRCSFRALFAVVDRKTGEERR